MRVLLTFILSFIIAGQSASQVVQQGSPTRSFNYQGGVSVDSFFRVPIKSPHRWSYNPDSVASIGFDPTDQKLKYNDGTGVVTILSEKDTALIKYYIDNNPKITIVWDSIKNKPGIIDSIAIRFQNYYTKTEIDSITLENGLSVVKYSDTANMLQGYQGEIQNLHSQKADKSTTISINGQAKSLAQNNSWIITKTDVGLGNVDNTPDISKPISAATQTALNQKENLSNKSNDTLLGTSQTLYPSQGAVKKYVDNQIAYFNSNIENDYVKISGSSMTGPLSLSGNPTQSLHAVPKQYLNERFDKRSFKKPVTAVSLSNVNINAPEFNTLDGISLTPSVSRVLLTGQLNASQNGVYVWHGNSTSMTRDADMNTWDEFVGAIVHVMYGNAYKNSLWAVDAAPSNGVLNTTNITFTQFPSKSYIDSLHNELGNGTIAVTGDATKTITVKKYSGSTWLTTSFTDNDNQTLSISGDSLSISGGNKVKILLSEPTFSSSGSTATTYTLPGTPASGKHIFVTLNTAFVDEADYTLTGNQLHLLFPIETTDKLKIYYKTK